jgi:hypothetical protein
MRACMHAWGMSANSQRGTKICLATWTNSGRDGTKTREGNRSIDVMCHRTFNRGFEGRSVIRISSRAMNPSRPDPTGFTFW